MTGSQCIVGGKVLGDGGRVVDGKSVEIRTSHFSSNETAMSEFELLFDIIFKGERIFGFFWLELV